MTEYGDIVRTTETRISCDGDDFYLPFRWDKPKAIGPYVVVDAHGVVLCECSTRDRLRIVLTALHSEYGKYE